MSDNDRTDEGDASERPAAEPKAPARRRVMTMVELNRIIDTLRDQGKLDARWYDLRR